MRRWKSIRTAVVTIFAVLLVRWILVRWILERETAQAAVWTRFSVDLQPIAD